MNQRYKFIAMLGIVAMTWLLLGAFFGGAQAASSISGAAQLERANPIILPPSQAATVTVPADTNQQPQTGGTTTTTNQTTNIGINIPSWVWIVGLVLLAVIVVLVAGGRSGGNTTVIKD